MELEAIIADYSVPMGSIHLHFNIYILDSALSTFLTPSGPVLEGVLNNVTLNRAQQSSTTMQVQEDEGRLLGRTAGSEHEEDSEG